MSISPGPWKWYHANGINRYAVSDLNRFIVCGLPDGDEANARLIAAAPDLLDACEYLLVCCKQHHWALMADEEIELVEMTEKAVRKARGDITEEVVKNSDGKSYIEQLQKDKRDLKHEIEALKHKIYDWKNHSRVLEDRLQNALRKNEDLQSEIESMKEKNDEVK